MKNNKKRDRLITKKGVTINTRTGAVVNLSTHDFDKTKTLGIRIGGDRIGKVRVYDGVGKPVDLFGKTIDVYFRGSNIPSVA